MVMTSTNNPGLSPTGKKAGKEKAVEEDPVVQSARLQRQNMTDEEWKVWLTDLAERFEGILQTLVKVNGPEGMEFRVRWKNPGSDTEGDA